MVKFVASRENGRKIVGIGITAGNIERLRNGKPIHIHLEELGLPWACEVMIIYGDTEQSLADDLKGLIGPDTVVNRERKSQ